MCRLSRAVMLLTATILSFASVQTASAKEINIPKPAKQSATPAKPANLLIGKWTITCNPVDATGKPCPYLPQTIEFFKDGTLMMSATGDIHMPYKTELTAEETLAFEKRPGLKGKQVLLIRPTSEMDWKATPMVYVYTVTKDELTLTMEGWEKATFKRSK